MAAKMEYPISYRFQCALACPFAQRCQELAIIIEQSSLKDIHTLFPHLVENVFGFGNQPGWGLKQLSRQLHYRDFDAVRRFLSPEGALMRLVDKLMHDGYLRYEFPISCLPFAVCQNIQNGIIPPFYNNKIQTQGPGKTPAFYLLLNPFEFFIFHLAYFMIGSHEQTNSLEWSTPGESLYAYVIEDYLHYFLPCDGGFTPAPPYFALSSTNQHSPHQTRTRNESRRSTPSNPLQGLFKIPAVTRQTSATNMSPKDAGQSELYRTDVFAQTLIEFWLNHYSSEMPRNVFSSGSDRIHSFSQKIGSSPERHCASNASFLSASSLSFHEAFFPTSDHIRLVRMFIKHIHYFSNSARINSTNPFDDFKRTIIQNLLQKKLYVFTKHLFDHWPMDASFRLVLEMWLSYIQPWRYVDTNALRSPSREKVEEKDRIILSRWQSFVEENLVFYGVFFQKMIPRLLRVDLGSPKNASMLHRLTKVFSQVNLKPLIQEAEEMQPTPFISTTSFSRLSEHSPLSRSAAAAGHASIIRQHINELESPSFVYVTMFGEEMAAQVQQLLFTISQAKESVHRTLTTAKTKQRGFFSGMAHSVWSLFQFDGNQDSADGDCWATDGYRVEQYLDIATSQLLSLFQFQPQVLDSLMQRLNRVESLNTMDGDTIQRDEDDIDGDGLMTPLRRYKIITKQAKPTYGYHGDPDLQPIRSYEITFLVRLFFQISTMFNDKYGHDLQQLYERNDMLGRVCRQFIQPPTLCRTYAHHGMPSPVKQKILPPRISLRPLAHRQLIGYVLSFFGIGWVFGFSLVGTAFFLVACVLAFVFGKAAVQPYLK